MATVQWYCYSCGKMTLLTQSVGIRDVCINCSADVHACKNCEFYDLMAYNECREPAADVVREKERANFCDFFKVMSGNNRSSQAATKKSELRAAAEALFKKK